MKSKHFLLTLLALTTSAASFADVPEGNITFADPAVKTICVAQWDTNSDGELSYAEAAAVTSIAYFTFNSRNTIQSFNEFQYFTGITSLGTGAFQNCTSLTSITIPENVTSIGYNAFSQCHSLTSINIPDGVTYIQKETFLNCSSLTNITIPDGVTSIGASAFAGCSSLTSINIPDGVTSIRASTFSSCYSLTSINIPDGITSIEDYALSGCSSLTSITIPDGVTSIGTQAFYNSKNFKFIHCASTTPEYSYVNDWGTTTVMFVPDEAVDSYRAAWPEHASQIVPETSNTYVYNVYATAQEEASDVVEKIGEENALKVVNLKVSGTINSYDVMVFRNKMLNLRNLDLSDATIVASSYTYYNNQYKTKDNVVTAYFGPSTLWSIILPTNITVLDENALRGCKWVSSITIPNSVTSIGASAFYGCSSLTSIIVPDGVTSLGSSAFCDCSKLTSATIGNGVTSIGPSTFSGCTNLTSVTIPNSVTSLGSSAFQGCSKIASIDLPKVLTTIGANAFKDCSALYNIKIQPYVESIGSNAFNGCTQLNDIKVLIPDYTLSVNENAFSSYTTATLRIPDFLYRNYYYNEGGWKRFINIVRYHLVPGDYETLPTNTDTSISGNDEIIPNISEGNPIDGEIFSEGSVTVTDDVTETQEFDEVVQNLDGEGHGGSLIGKDNGSTAGNLRVNTLRVKINVKAGRWYFFCFPYDVTIASCTYPGQYAWRWYDGAERAANGSGGWKAVAGSTLTAGQGYAFQTSHTGDMVVEFSDPKFGGDRPKTLVAHASANAANASWNLVGNPYTSFYDFLSTDFDAPITVYNSNGTYSAYRPADDECHLQPFEAFFVQKPTEVDAINFNADRRESYNQGQTKKAERQKVRRRAGFSPQRRLINLEILNGEVQADKTRVVLNNEKSHAYELDCDASKFMSNEATAQLYSIENGVNMAINERPLQGDIRLGYTAKTAGTLSINAPRMDMPMVLVDTKLNTTFDLSLGAYEFDTQAGTFNNRFMLRPSGEATAINSLMAKTGVCIGTQDGGIAIGGAEGKTVNVYTTGGAQAAQHSGNGYIALKSGVYVVSVDGVSAKVRVR